MFDGLIIDVKKVKNGTYLINEKVLLTIQPDGTVNASFDDISEEEVEKIIDEFFEKPVEKLY